MARETNTDASIPANGAEGVPYFDRRELIQGVLRHMGEVFLAQGTGAGGAGFDIENVPFEPAAIIAINQAGATPAVHMSAYSSTPAHATIAAATAANANPATLTQIGPNDWTVGLTTQMAPDGEVVTVILVGARDVNGGL